MRFAAYAGVSEAESLTKVQISQIDNEFLDLGGPGRRHRHSSLLPKGQFLFCLCSDIAKQCKPHGEFAKHQAWCSVCVS